VTRPYDASHRARRLADYSALTPLPLLARAAAVQKFELRERAKEIVG
jgi:hypothetical protein